VKNGQIYKDLEMLGGEMENVVLVDDNRGTIGFYPRNSIRMPAWKGSTIDKILTRNLPEVLEEWKKEDDVRKVIDRLAGKIGRSSFETFIKLIGGCSKRRSCKKTLHLETQYLNKLAKLGVMWENPVPIGAILTRNLPEVLEEYRREDDVKKEILELAGKLWRCQKSSLGVVSRFRISRVYDRSLATLQS
jgi:hypothetical protein